MLAALAILAALSAPRDPPAPPPPAPTPPAAPRRPPVRIQAEDVDYRLKEGRTVMTGKPLVTLTREDAVLTCLRLVLDSDPKGKFQRATCEGEVKLTRGTRVITCATAVYEDELGRVTCKGHPRMTDGPSEMTGEELVYDLDDDRVRLTRGQGVLFEPGPKGGGRP